MMNWVLSSIEKAPSFENYKQHITTILDNLYSNPVLSIELCKTATEGICKKILTDKAEQIPDRFPNLVSTTITSLHLDHHSDVVHLTELTKRLGAILHYIGEIRNQCNFASHGQDVSMSSLSSDLAVFVANTTNAVLGFILHFYIVTGDYRQGERIRYEDFQEFNDFLDENYPINMGGLILSYSEALFNQDIEAYKEMFNEFHEIQSNKK